MREFFELVCEYPWATCFLVIALCFILESLGVAIHGPNKIIIYKDQKDNET